MFARIFEVRLGRLVQRFDAEGRRFFEQKRVDVMLAVDLIYYALSSHVSDIALIAGDADFIPAVRRAKDSAVRIWLFHGKRSSIAHDLYHLADGRIPLIEDDTARFPIRSDL